MRILVVASDFPWPKIQGGHLRLTRAIEALAELGKLDLAAPYDDRRSVPTLPPTVPVERLKTLSHPASQHQLRWRAAWLARRGIPLEVARQRIDAAPRLELESWMADRYDLVWFDRAATFECMGRPRLGPTIVDLHDLEDVKARSRAQIMQAQLSWRGGAASFRRAIAVAQARLNARDWRQFQRSVAGDVDRVVLCSDLDVRRSGLANAVVVPNSYERPKRAVGRTEVGEPAVVLFQATFDYAPNMDAVDWLVGEVAPRIRTRVPDVELRLVGTPVPGVRRQHRPPAVTVVGVVSDMEPELARADIAIVPIRYGSGTRLKILESFAHRVPVVSTTIGAEGLQVEDGVHLLLADDPETFAAACERLLTEPDLRERLVDAAEKRFFERYERSVAHDRIQALAREVAGDRGSCRGDDGPVDDVLESN
jgi:glycosyltransferase involved in cell wall biosynthesis